MASPPLQRKNRAFPPLSLRARPAAGLHCHNHAIEGRQWPGQVFACLLHATAGQPPRGHSDMKFRHSLAASCALIPVALLSTPAFAQSTGSVDFDDEIVVTGVNVSDVAGITSPDTSKAKSVLGQEVIARQNPGQTILVTINLVPGVTFTNNDAYGSSG